MIKIQCRACLTLNRCIILLSAILLLAVTSRLIASENYAEKTGETTGSILENKDGVPRISPKELMNRIMKGKSILIVDVRSAGEYRAGHILSAISVPLAEVESRIDDFSREKDIVFY